MFEILISLSFDDMHPIILYLYLLTGEPQAGHTTTFYLTFTLGRKPYSVELKQGDTLISGTGFSCSDVGDYSVKCTYQHSAGKTVTQSLSIWRYFPFFAVASVLCLK